MKPFIEYDVNFVKRKFKKTEDLEKLDCGQSYNLMYRIENILAIDYDIGAPSCFVVINKDVCYHEVILNRISEILKETL